MLYTQPTESVHLKKKQTNQHNSSTGDPKTMDITPDYIAAESYNPYNVDRKYTPNEGLIILNLNKFSLRTIKQTIIETRLASNEDNYENYRKLDLQLDNRIHIKCNYSNNSIVFNNLSSGESFDIKITIDGTEHILKNVKATGIKQVLKLNIKKEA